MSKLNTGKWIIAALFSFLMAICQAAVAEEQVQAGESRPGESYLPGDALTEIAIARQNALQNNTRVLVVMGANWCHDSRALAARLVEAPLDAIITEHYELVFVDVGNLDKGNDVITSLGEPVWYATPTVLIVDPVSEKLVNDDNRHQWGAAASISLQDTLDYFQLMADRDLQPLRQQGSEEQPLAGLLSQIDAFEQQQARRVYAAYAVLTPMLEAYSKGDKSGWSEETWIEISRFRMQIPRDLDALRRQARQRAAAGEVNIQLDYPVYPSFSWEQ